MDEFALSANSFSPTKGHPVEAEKSQPHSVALRVLPSIVLHKKSFTLGETWYQTSFWIFPVASIITLAIRQTKPY
jgi:hypothetical protein